MTISLSLISFFRSAGIITFQHQSGCASSQGRDPRSRAWHHREESELPNDPRVRRFDEILLIKLCGARSAPSSHMREMPAHTRLSK
jgi:hypothetical protein